MLPDTVDVGPWRKLDLALDMAEASCKSHEFEYIQFVLPKRFDGAVEAAKKDEYL